MDIYWVSRSESADIASWLSPELDSAALSYSSVWCPTAPLAARDTGSCKYWCRLGQQDLFHHNCQRLGKRRNCWWKKSWFHHWCFSLTLKLVGRIGANCRLEFGSTFKFFKDFLQDLQELITQKLKTILWFTHPHVVPKIHAFIFFQWNTTGK